MYMDVKLNLSVYGKIGNWNKELERILGLKKEKVIGQRKLHSEKFYKEFYLMGHNAVYSIESQLMFWKNISQA
jgi:hypothetical protein